MAALAYFLADCSGADNLVLDAPRSDEILGTLLQQLAACATDAITSPGGAVAAAVSAVAAAYGKDKAIVVSDRAFSGKVDKLANFLKVLGKLIKLYTVAKLVAALTHVVIDSRQPAAGRATTVRLNSSKTAARVATFTGYGNIKVGMTTAEALENSIAPLTKQTVGPCTYLVDTGGQRVGGLSVLLNRDGHVIGMTVPDNGKTDKGIRVGSTYAQAKTAYRNITTETAPDAGGYHLLVVGQGGAIGFHSATLSDPIAQILVGRKDYAAGYELCSDNEPPA